MHHRIIYGAFEDSIGGAIASVLSMPYYFYISNSWTLLSLDAEISVIGELLLDKKLDLDLGSYFS